jgi:hypothetical protein
MEAILANFLRQHKSHDALWYFIKMKQNATPNDTTKPPKYKEDKPNEYFLSAWTTRIFGVGSPHFPQIASTAGAMARTETVCEEMMLGSISWHFTLILFGSPSWL